MPKNHEYLPGQVRYAIDEGDFDRAHRMVHKQEKDGTLSTTEADDMHTAIESAYIHMDPLTSFQHNVKQSEMIARRELGKIQAFLFTARNLSPSPEEQQVLIGMARRGTRATYERLLDQIG